MEIGKIIPQRCFACTDKSNCPINKFKQKAEAMTGPVDISEINKTASEEGLASGHVYNMNDDNGEEEHIVYSCPRGLGKIDLQLIKEKVDVPV